MKEDRGSKQSGGAKAAPVKSKPTVGLTSPSMMDSGYGFNQRDTSASLSYQPPQSEHKSERAKTSEKPKTTQPLHSKEVIAIYEGIPNPIDWVLEKLAEAALITITAGGVLVIATAEQIEVYLDSNPDVAAVALPIVDLLISGPDSLIGWGVFEARRGQGDTSSSRGREQKQFDDAVKEVERGIGRRLDPDEQQAFHDAITEQGYGFWEMVYVGLDLFGGDVTRVPRDKWPDWAQND